MPGSKREENQEADNGVVNDSLGKIDTADTTGTGEEDQSCEKPQAAAGHKRIGQENSPRRS